MNISDMSWEETVDFEKSIKAQAEGLQARKLSWDEIYEHYGEFFAVAAMGKHVARKKMLIEKLRPYRDELQKMDWQVDDDGYIGIIRKPVEIYFALGPRDYVDLRIDWEGAILYQDYYKDLDPYLKPGWLKRAQALKEQIRVAAIEQARKEGKK